MADNAPGVPTNFTLRQRVQLTRRSVTPTADGSARYLVAHSEQVISIVESRQSKT